jgi:hypothetical protein
MRIIIDEDVPFKRLKSYFNQGAHLLAFNLIGFKIDVDFRVQYWA